MPSYKTRAIILKSYNLGEADKIIKLFSQSEGLVDTVAKGARKIKSKFGGRLELFNFVELELSKGKNLDIINQAEILKNFGRISQDFNKFLFCQLISEIILRTHLSATEVVPLVFKLAYACFDEIDQICSGNIYDIEKIGVFFISKFLKITGYTPLISNCCKCGDEIQTSAQKMTLSEPEAQRVSEISSENRNISVYFSTRLGGLLCRRCAAGIENIPDMKKALSKQELLLLFYLFSLGMKQYRQLKIDACLLNDMYKLLEDYMKYHAECNISISGYLNKILA